MRETSKNALIRRVLYVAACENSVRIVLAGVDRLTPDGGQAQFFGHPDELRYGFGPHLVHHLPAVQLDGDFAGAQVGRLPHVEHQAAGRVRGLMGEKLPGGPEGLDAEPH
jgi:hypothetical protein